MPVKELRPYIKKCWRTIRALFIHGTCHPKPVKRVEIPKAGGGKRNPGVPIGYAVLEYTFFGFGFASMLYLSDKYRRKGIGKRLMEDLENKCKTDKIFTSTDKSNKPMQKLLKKLNYEKSGIIHNLDPGDPELFYYKNITQK